MSPSFADPPAGAGIHLEPFKVAIPEESLQELQASLAHSRLGPVTYENSQQDRRYGITREWLENAVKVWQHEFDW